MAYIDKTLGVGESTESITAKGYCDVLVEGLTSGTVNLEYMLEKTTEYTNPTWTAWPSVEGQFTQDDFVTLYVAQDNFKVRLTGSGNNAGVYVKIGRFIA